MKNKERKGFTLVELLVVIAILAILTTVSIIGYTSFTKKAYISNDTTLVAQLNEQLRLYEVENDKITKESQINEILKQCDCFELIPKSARYGYHIWFDISQHCFILAKIDEEQIDNTSLYISNNIKEMFSKLNVFADEIEQEIIGSNLITDNVFRIAIKENCYLIDKGGSNLADALSILDNPKDGEEYKHAIELIFCLKSDKHDSVACDTLKEIANNTTIFSNNGIFEPENPTGEEEEAKTYFVDGILSISKEHFTFTVENDTTINVDNTVDFIKTKSKEIVLPKTLTAPIEKLYFANKTNTVIVLPEGKSVADLFTASSTNALIKTSDAENPEYFVIAGKEVHKSDATGTDTGEKVGEDLVQLTLNDVGRVFDNIDTYLYRIGNANTVTLGQLFELDNSVKSDEVSIKVEAIEENSTVKGTVENSNLAVGSTAKCVYTKNTDNWKSSTLKFSGEGPVKVTIAAEGYNPFTLNLEIVNGENVTTATSATSKNIVLLNDVSTSSLTVSGGYTLYGNGFTVADTRVADSDATIGMTKAYVYINGGIVDNVFFKGYEPTEQVPLGNTKRQSSSAVYVYGTGSQIYNSHISGGRYAVLFYNAKDAYMESSVIDGGSIGCIGITNAYVTLKDCVTTLSTQGGLKGAGIHVPSVDNGHLTILGSFEQHNWVQINDLPDTYQSLVNDLYKNSDFKYDYDGKTYVNAGIFFMSEANSIDTNQAKEFITDANDSMYVYSTKSSYVYTGTMRSAKAVLGSPEMVAVADTSTTQYGVLPTYSFDFTDKNYKAKESGNNNYCYYDSTAKKVMISYDKTTSDTTFSWDPNILSVTKFGNALIPEYSILPATGWTKVNGKVLFAEEGDYTVTYTYTDPYNYDKDLNSGSKTYTHTVNLNIVNVKPEAVVYHPEFIYADSWSSYSSKQVVVNNKTYIMPDATATSDNVGSTTVGGQTIYYPIISLEGKDSSGNKYSSGKIYYFAPAFKAININDLNKVTGNTLYTYNTTTTTWPHNMSAKTKITQGEFFGYGSTRPYGAATGATYEQCAKNTNNGGLCFTSNEIERNVTESNVLVEFYYVGNDGITYYYYIKYHYNATTYSGGSCVAKGTLITMADGSQKKIEDLEANDMIIAFNHETGEYEETPIFMVVNHGTDNYSIMNLQFEDGTNLEMIESHGLFDFNLNQYVDFTEENYSNYVGHYFAKYSDNGTTIAVKLENVEIYSKETDMMAVFSFGNLNAITNGFVSYDTKLFGTYNYFEYDENMKYIASSMEYDIAKYGVYDYEHWAKYIPFETYDAFNFKYFKVAVEKGLCSESDIVGYILWLGELLEEGSIPVSNYVK